MRGGLFGCRFSRLLGMVGGLYLMVLSSVTAKSESGRWKRQKGGETGRGGRRGGMNDEGPFVGCNCGGDGHLSISSSSS